MQQAAVVSSVQAVPPSGWVRRFTPLLPPGLCLDLACGGGRHTQWLLAQGRPVLALDRDPAALHALQQLGAETMLHDLESGPDGVNWPFGEHTFDSVIVCNYLHRPLFPHLLSSLKEGGLLIYETFSDGNAQFGRPSNPDFLLRTGELLQQMQSNPLVQMQIIAYENGVVETPGVAMVQRICARKASALTALDSLCLRTAAL